MVRKRRKTLLFVTYAMWATLLYPLQVLPFATESHKVINGAAALGSQTNSYLTNTLGFIVGLQTLIKDSRGVDLRIVDWIREGGAAEDKLVFDGKIGEMLGGLTRSRRHFHHPLRSWDQAGLKRIDDSSVRWAQNPSQDPGRKASWFDARRTYLDALKAATEQERNAMFAETFQTLGQVMHLVADLGSVAHARDDIHINPLGYTFEDFVLKRSDLITGLIGFDSSILQQPTGDSFATVPIARLWDTNTYNGTNPPGDSDRKIGLAEFTNANFFSEDTIRETAGADPELPLPAIDRLVPGQRIKDPRTQEERQYLKSGGGVPVEHMVMALEGGFVEYSEFSFPVLYQLDDVVYQDYARHLLPRAIGYSAGILNYFFRGKIKIGAPDRFVYALANYVPGNTGSFTKMRFKVSNATDYPSTTEDTVGPGQMWAVVRYRKVLSGNLFENPFANLSDPSYAVSAPKSVSLTRTAQEITFDFTENKIPTNAADIFLMVVWQGKLGLEDGAVMVGGKDLFEPDPLDFGNGTDYDCFQQTLYHVADLNAFPRYNPPTQTQRDVSNPKDGIQDLFGPSIENDQFIKTYDLSKPQTASPSLFDFKVSQHEATLAGPQYSRFVLLQDQSLYAFSWRVGSSVEVPSGIADTTPRFYNFSVEGILNDFTVDPGTGARIRRVTPNFRYRGVPTFHIFVFVVGGLPRFEPCLSASFLLPEPFTRIEGELAPE